MTFVRVWLRVVPIFLLQHSRVIVHVNLLNPVLESAFEHSSRYSSVYLKPLHEMHTRRYLMTQLTKHTQKMVTVAYKKKFLVANMHV